MSTVVTDPYTEAPIRFLGLCIAFAQAVYCKFSEMRKYMYITGVTFILAHVVTNIYCHTEIKSCPHNMKHGALETLIFDLIASVAIPVAVSRYMCRVSLNFVRKHKLGIQNEQHLPLVIAITVVTVMSVPVDFFTVKFIEAIRKNPV